MAHQTIEQIIEDAEKEINGAADSRVLNDLSVKYLGRKGIITQYLRNVSDLPEEIRPEQGKKANQAKERLSKGINQAERQLEEKRLVDIGGIDVSSPGRPMMIGTLHPITKMTAEICDTFIRLGFEVVEGPEVEKDYYNFEALNFPKDHPARDMQDTFFVSNDIVLRTHTSPMQVRVMEKHKPPLRIIAPGKVYRCDSDITHTPMFHQVEGMLVDENASFGDLKGILTAFIHQIFDEEISLRFRPSFFPFTEPSAEVDILCVICRGKGCRVCSHTGWLEVLGSGMVHPAVFENVGYDSSKYIGFAFGIGVERIAMLKYQVDDIRKYFENDSRFLRQF
ncbi:MAG: phenylalanine--tRNA ligase subunit alpha [Proteobacteria bacterium]|nr:phenylalanine--tRNA ligase subunit alpha [Pseudomonadota bacterium]MBU4470074.1 phenylalanine--tRNA ligase subunit alpha [Pseudomonadota bacterium]MCG2750719.1 phenylalanine--tRNA ligase subunit alpha [Desulfobacteraceae bacterium]